MLDDHHDLVHEFPEHRDTIHTLKVSNGHFARLFQDYQLVDKEIRRIEQEIETVSDQYAETLKVKRLSLKDQLFEMIRKHEAAA